MKLKDLTDDPDLAAFSPCRRWRYRLTREWWEGSGTVTFIMLNPSTADERRNDPTVRRCIGYAKAWGHARLHVLNIFALRATDPGRLITAPEPVGAGNDAEIAETLLDTDVVVCAWGTMGGLAGRDAEVMRLIREADQEPQALRVTKLGHPQHPLYLPADLRPVPYRRSD